MSDAVPLFEQRRYSAVVFAHPEMKTYRDFARIMRGVVVSPKPVRGAPAGW